MLSRLIALALAALLAFTPRGDAALLLAGAGSSTDASSYTPAAPAYTNLGGTGKRSWLITITTDLSFGAGNISTMIDGEFANSTFFADQSGAKYIKFDFGAGSPKIINELKWTAESGPSKQYGTWQFAGSNDDASYTNIGSTFALGGSTGGSQTITTMSANTTGYRYYKMTNSGSLSGGGWAYEIEFKIAGASAGGKRYWRFNASAVQGSSGPFFAASEIEFRATSGGADQTTGKTAFGSSRYSVIYDYANIIDNNNSTNWASAGVGQGGETTAPLPQWIAVDFGTGSDITVAEATMRNRGDSNADQSLTTGTIDYLLENGDAWVTAKSLSGLSWTLGETKTFSVP